MKLRNVLTIDFFKEEEIYIILEKVLSIDIEKDEESGLMCKRGCKIEVAGIFTRQLM